MYLSMLYLFCKALPKIICLRITKFICLKVMLQSLEENISSNNILQHPDNGCTLYKKGHPQNTLKTETEYHEIKQNINMPTGPLWIRSHVTKSHMPGHKLHRGTSKPKQLGPVHLDLPLFFNSHCATCFPASTVHVWFVHVTGSCKGSIICI